jgi:hypothetical protein
MKILKSKLRHVILEMLLKEVDSNDKMYNVPGDKTWKYKTKNNEWLVQKAGWSPTKWTTLAGDKYVNARARLDKRFPDARSEASMPDRLEGGKLLKLNNLKVPPSFNGNQNMKNVYTQILNRKIKTSDYVGDDANIRAANYVDAVFRDLASKVAEGMNADQVKKLLVGHGLEHQEVEDLESLVSDLVSDSNPAPRSSAQI